MGRQTKKGPYGVLVSGSSTVHAQSSIMGAFFFFFFFFFFFLPEASPRSFLITCLRTAKALVRLSLC